MRMVGDGQGARSAGPLKARACRVARLPARARAPLLAYTCRRSRPGRHGASKSPPASQRARARARRRGARRRPGFKMGRPRPDPSLSHPPILPSALELVRLRPALRSGGLPADAPSSDVQTRTHPQPHPPNPPPHPLSSTMSSGGKAAGGKGGKTGGEADKKSSSRSAKAGLQVRALVASQSLSLSPPRR